MKKGDKGSGTANPATRASAVESNRLNGTSEDVSLGEDTKKRFVLELNDLLAIENVSPFSNGDSEITITFKNETKGTTSDEVKLPVVVASGIDAVKKKHGRIFGKLKVNPSGEEKDLYAYTFCDSDSNDRVCFGVTVGEPGSGEEENCALFGNKFAIKENDGSNWWNVQEILELSPQQGRYLRSGFKSARIVNSSDISFCHFEYKDLELL
jgi:hypothetical protein